MGNTEGAHSASFSDTTTLRADVVVVKAFVAALWDLPLRPHRCFVPTLSADTFVIAQVFLDKLDWRDSVTTVFYTVLVFLKHQ